MNPTIENPSLDTLTRDLPSLSLSTLANVIRLDWKKPYFGAVPYLAALRTLESVRDTYGADDGRSIVRYFLSNATTWRGSIARAVKAELQRRLKA